MKDRCPLGVPEILTVAYVANYFFLYGVSWLSRIATHFWVGTNTDWSGKKYNISNSPTVI